MATVTTEEEVGVGMVVETEEAMVAIMTAITIGLRAGMGSPGNPRMKEAQLRNC